MPSFLKRYRMFKCRWTKKMLATLFLLGALTVILPSVCTNVSLNGAEYSFWQRSAIAQPTPIRRIDPETLAQQIYQQLPELPLENQYINSDGEPAVENTLASRLIRYHVYIKNRPTVFRFDWKLTLADYLGAFESISPESYPDYDLQESPLQNDIVAIDSLSSAQRIHLVNALYETFTASSADDLDSP